MYETSSYIYNISKIIFVISVILGVDPISSISISSQNTNIL